ncbi:hypothetical protein [Sphingomonas bacterium]|uniref:hypothetical protein n=1 Tax=Sphingomonas bacterium TaxID=1895847 RepID=UPI00260E1FBB|nr:hypothetical protein [Sphingomonas bacterium]MDB5677590.1 hypothetical protein [Sphingomonas bacterium]
MPKLKVDGIEVEIPLGAPTSAGSSPSRSIGWFSVPTRWLWMAALASVVGASSAAIALPERARPASSDEARLVLRGYAECLVRNAPSQVDSFLAMSPFDPGFGRRGAEISISGCLVGGRLKFTALLLRGALFAAKYKRDFGRQAPTFLIDRIDLVPAGVSATAPDGGAAIRLTVTAADCIAMRDRDGARALILAPLGSKAEKSMITRLSPVTAACAPGLDLARAREPIEAALAEVLYRRAAQASALTGKSN